MPAVKARLKARPAKPKLPSEIKSGDFLNQLPPERPEFPPLTASPPKSKSSKKWLFFWAGTYVLCKLAYEAYTTGLVGRSFIYSALELALISAFFPWHKFEKGSALLLSLTAMVLMALGLLSMPSFGMALGPDHPFNFQIHYENPWAWILTGAFLLFMSLRALPEKTENERDLSVLTARIWFWVIMGIAAWMRLFHFREPSPFYWDDYMLAMVDARGVLDFGENHMIFSVGDRQPFYNYLVVLVYKLFPHWSSIVVQNVTWAAIDLAGIWVLYLLGKEVGGRRVGLMVAGLGAVSKPILIGCLTDQPLVTTPLAVATALLFTFRVVKNPDLKHFIQWGAAIAFAAYCYQTSRPYIWILPMAVLLTLLSRPKERQAGWRVWFLAVGSALAWSFGFFYINLFLPASNPATAFILKPWVPDTIGFILLYFCVSLKNDDEPGKPKSLTAYWALGLFFSVLLMFPIICEPNFATHASNVSIFHHEGKFNADWSIVTLIVHKFWDTLQTIFNTGPDRVDMGLPYEAFFEFQGVLVALLGIVYCLVRPSWTKAFLGACALIALIPHVFSIDPHSGKLLGFVAPVFLLGSLAADKVLRELSTLPFGKVWAALGLFLFLGLWSWNIWDMYQRFYVVVPSHAYNEVIVHNQVKIDAPKYRTYLYSSGPFFSFSTQGILDEEYDVYVMNPGFNPIDVAPGEKKSDVVILLPGTATDAVNRLHREFPTAQWEETRAYYQPPTDAAFMKRVFIPAESIPLVASGVKAQPKMVYFQEVPPQNSWRQRLYAVRVGLGRGLIQWEGKVADPLTRIPGANGTQSASVEGMFKAPVSGRYSLSTQTGNYAVLSIGGRKVLDLRPRMQILNETDRTYIKAGTYPLKLVTYFQVNLDVPGISVQLPGEKNKRTLGSF